MPTYIYRCPKEDCLTEFDWFGKFEERQEQLPCPGCGGSASYNIGSPMVLEASYLDGQRGKTDKAWKKMKDESKLKVERARTHNTEGKAEITAEIDKIRGKNRGPRKSITDQLFNK